MIDENSLTPRQALHNLKDAYFDLRELRINYSLHDLENLAPELEELGMKLVELSRIFSQQKYE